MLLVVELNARAARASSLESAREILREWILERQAERPGEEILGKGGYAVDDGDHDLTWHLAQVEGPCNPFEGYAVLKDVAGLPVLEYSHRIQKLVRAFEERFPEACALDFADSSCTAGFDNDGSTGGNIFENGFKFALEAAGRPTFSAEAEGEIVLFFVGEEDDVVARLKKAIADGPDGGQDGE